MSSSVSGGSDSWGDSNLDLEPLGDVVKRSDGSYELGSERVLVDKKIADLIGATGLTKLAVALDEVTWEAETVPLGGNMEAIIDRSDSCFLHDKTTGKYTHLTPSGQTECYSVIGKGTTPVSSPHILAPALTLGNTRIYEAGGAMTGLGATPHTYFDVVRESIEGLGDLHRQRATFKGEFNPTNVVRMDGMGTVRLVPPSTMLEGKKAVGNADRKADRRKLTEYLRDNMPLAAKNESRKSTRWLFGRKLTYAERLEAAFTRFEKDARPTHIAAKHCLAEVDKIYKEMERDKAVGPRRQDDTYAGRFNFKEFAAACTQVFGTKSEAVTLPNKGTVDNPYGQSGDQWGHFAKGLLDRTDLPKRTLWDKILGLRGPTLEQDLQQFVENAEMGFYGNQSDYQGAFSEILARHSGFLGRHGMKVAPK